LRKLVNFRKHCFQRFQVGMYIRKNGVTHNQFTLFNPIVIG
jgi:hypothetical protein